MSQPHTDADQVAPLLESVRAGFANASRRGEPPPDEIVVDSLWCALTDIETATPTSFYPRLELRPGVAAPMEVYAFLRETTPDPVDRANLAASAVAAAVERSRDVLQGYFIDREIPEMSATDAIVFGTVLENGGSRREWAYVLERAKRAAARPEPAPAAIVDTGHGRPTTSGRVQQPERHAEPSPTHTQI